MKRRRKRKREEQPTPPYYHTLDELVIELFIYSYLYTFAIYNDKDGHQYEYNIIVLHS